MKAIGILGGLGPQATMDFEAHIHRVAQAYITPQWGSGYPPTIVYYHRAPPMKMNADFTPMQPLQADPNLLEAAARLGSWADFLVIPSNTPHLFLSELEAAAGCPILSIIEAAMQEIKRRQWHTVGLLEVGDPRVYPSPLKAAGLEYKVADAELRSGLGAEISRVMEGRDTEASKTAAAKAIANLRKQGVDGIILGCTEIPLLLSEEIDQTNLINPAQLLAEAAVKYAIGLT